MTEHIGTPGDLGRRVRLRREALGLTRRQVATRAGIDPGYLEYLEENTASPTAGTVERLASALDTTGEKLLGGIADLPAGHGHAARPGPESPPERLDADECVRLISPGGVGRVAFDSPTGPTVLPVGYVTHGGAVVVRTAFGGPPEEDLRTGVEGGDVKVAFEADRIDEGSGRGWSVLVRGPAHHISSRREREAVSAAHVAPWAGDGRELYIRIVPVEISGWRVHRGPRRDPASGRNGAQEWP